ncbi:hypothetical protein H0H93_005039 [Arthromyces matolae]|nr:hypothetical protein H0H93_005039 [Arthromyces matolae]
MHTPILPQELVDQIIGQLHDDSPDLKSCALVSKAWLAPSRSHIFYRISLQPPPPTRFFAAWRRKSALRSLLDIINVTPEIALYIRDVEIVEGVGDREWVVKDPSLFHLLSKLKDVQRFRLCHSAGIPIPWRALSPGLPIAILQILALPSLCALDLGMLSFSSADVFVSLLERLNNLRVLYLDHIQVGQPVLSSSNDNSASQSPNTHRAPLDKLVLGARTSPLVVGCLLHTNSSVNLNSLRHMSISISGNFEEFARMLRVAVGLETLELLLMSDIDLPAYLNLPLSDRLDMSHNPYLNKLTVKIDVIQRQDDPLPWINGLFSTFTTPNRLCNVHIVYSLYLPAPYMDRSVNTTIFAGWQEIDATLTGPVFEFLQQVRLEFSLENPIGFDVAPRFLNEVNLQSPLLRASNRLTIEAFDTSR